MKPHSHKLSLLVSYLQSFLLVSTLSLQLFVFIMEEISNSCRIGDPWELHYADYFLLTGESKEEVMNLFVSWKDVA